MHNYLTWIGSGTLSCNEWPRKHVSCRKMGPMKTYSNLFLTAVVIAGTVLATSARADTAYGTQSFGPDLWEVNLATGALTNHVTITLPGFSVIGATALTANPLDGSVWGIVRTASGNAGRRLARVNPLTGAATDVGAVPNGFSTLSFNSAGTLYGMTGAGGSPASTLYTLSTINAATTLVYGPVISGPDGEVIAFGPGDTLYHSSGNAAATFSTINLGPNTTTPLGTAPGEMFGMGYSFGLSTMFGTDIASKLFSINLNNGSRTFIGPTTDATGAAFDVRGLAIVRAVPEPASLLALGAGFALITRRRRK